MPDEHRHITVSAWLNLGPGGTTPSHDKGRRVGAARGWHMRVCVCRSGKQATGIAKTHGVVGIAKTHGVVGIAKTHGVVGITKTHGVVGIAKTHGVVGIAKTHGVAGIAKTHGVTGSYKRKACWTLAYPCRCPC